MLASSGAIIIIIIIIIITIITIIIISSISSTLLARLVVGGNPQQQSEGSGSAILQICHVDADREAREPALNVQPPALRNLHLICSLARVYRLQEPPSNHQHLAQGCPGSTAQPVLSPVREPRDRVLLAVEEHHRKAAAVLPGDAELPVAHGSNLRGPKSQGCVGPPELEHLGHRSAAVRLLLREGVQGGRREPDSRVVPGAAVLGREPLDPPLVPVVEARHPSDPQQQGSLRELEVLCCAEAAAEAAGVVVAEELEEVEPSVLLPGPLEAVRELKVVAVVEAAPEGLGELVVGGRVQEPRAHPLAVVAYMTAIISTGATPHPPLLSSVVPAPRHTSTRA